MFVLPYNQTTISLSARVSQVKDRLLYTTSGRSYWRGVSFVATSNHPTKEVRYGEIIRRGTYDLPDVYTAIEGNIYELTPYGWVPYNPTYRDVDEVYF